ncbi:MAG: Z1 domain-containing protein [Bosea sp. (in: a-proteobacteria)]|uniref:Z1 domain-containing protein n=1 Tax=Bosea sp. (in: a-proteobacteria) TaxID=1871050 RepID=UPI00273482A7|nr:Z1 domain-containing protein [Bosea sp. (in: a-proteobacteria)]MDP3600961.1 Z1 domain-containing protein [Bosea sp. (in: a-proteobacteria)]
MKPLLSSLEGMTSMFMVSQPGPHTAQSIRQIIEQLRGTPMFSGNVDDHDAEELARLIEEKHGISMGLGAIVDAEDFKPWLHDARINGKLGDFYWSRYRRLLNLKGLPKSVIDATDEVTDRVLDRLGDPRNNSRWSRRGMVVGHVQSGKTQNYTGLICKAADAGYRLIVVIAGIHNNLRNQTQARVDEGFIGRDTGRLAHANKAQRQKIIGVGQFDQREFPVSLTNTLRDFNKATATTNTSQIGQYNVPVVLVIKKNSSTLKNLLEWLKEHSLHQGTQMVSQPMLLIDDEADNASINTAYARDEVTRINGQIRELLSLFHRACYVGYTATPFANIFIDPDTDDEALKQDLFPRHFIIGLDAPSNYFGAQKVFLDARERHIRLIDDNEDSLPIKHRIDHSVDLLPESLVRAVRAFIVARAIRNVRGQQDSHASMLINASRFTDVQGRLRAEISDIVGRTRDAVAVDAGKGAAALRNPEIAALHAIWELEYAEADDADWSAVQSRLHEVLVAARVIEVNASKRSQALDYDQRGEHGVTVIAVGGFSLSRGLTLEGLTVSYFLRNSMMYDTLMQMGRWFGYRPGYEDLCRVWMPADGVGWYAHIHEAMDDLQTQLKRMELAKATPEQFGLAVRSHPETLIVTARNKMGTGKNIPVKVGLAGRMIETTRIRIDQEQLARNHKVGRGLAKAIRTSGLVASHPSRGTLYSSVPVGLVRDFLQVFRSDAADPLTDPRLISDYINARADHELKYWDVLFASAQKATEGEKSDCDLDGIEMREFGRSVGEDDLRRDVLAISGTSRRVGSPGDERVGLTAEQISVAIGEFKLERKRDGKKIPETLPPRIFCGIFGRRPLLILRFVSPTVNDHQLTAKLPGSVLAWTICFPPSNIQGGAVDYVVNTVRMREMFGEEEIEEEALGDTD